MILNPKNIFNKLGPGFVMAATGLGAGDMIAASVGGAKFGMALAWAVVLGAIFKYTLNAGLARWQLLTGTSLMQGWTKNLHPAINFYFIVFLVLWSFIVAGALAAACGLAANAIFPGFSVISWGIIHSMLALGIVWFGRYSTIENLMKIFIVLLFLVVLITGLLMVFNDPGIFNFSSMFQFPAGSTKFAIGIVGGVGGSVTLLSYGYWMKEKGWNGSKYIKTARLDLILAYVMTALFGLAIMVISSGLKPGDATGNQLVLIMAESLIPLAGQEGKWIFLIGFWAAVFSSMIGVFNGIPYLFADFMQHYKAGNKPSSHKIYYRGFLLYLAIPPLVLLMANKPVWIILIYTITGAFFMPFLAFVILLLNNSYIPLKKFRNNSISNLMLILILAFFLLLALYKLVSL